MGNSIWNANRKVGGLGLIGDSPDEALSDLGQFYRDARAQFDSDENFRARARARVVSLQTGDGAHFEEVGATGRHIDEPFQEVYVLLDVLLTEDDVMGESKYDHLLPDVVERLQKKGLLESNDGASVIYPGDWVNRDGDPLPLIIKKRDGDTTTPHLISHAS